MLQCPPGPLSFPTDPTMEPVISENKVFGSKPKCILGGGEQPRRRQFKPGSLSVILTAAMLASHTPPGSQAWAHVSGPAQPPGVAPLATALPGTQEGAGMTLLPKLANPGHRRQGPKGWP